MSILLLLAIGLGVPVLARLVVSPLRQQSLFVHLLLGVVGAVLSGMLARTMRGPDMSFYITGVLVPFVGALLALLLNPGRGPRTDAPALAAASGHRTSSPPGKSDLFRY